MITVIYSESRYLGNQLFQFAFGYAMSKKMHTDFNYNTGFIERFFELKPYNTPIFRLIRRARYIFSLKFNTYTTLALDQFISPDEIEKKVDKHCIVFGYFQSEFFFKNHKEQLKKILTPKSYYINLFFASYSQLFKKKTMAVHIRLGDYKTWKVNEINAYPLLPIDYYHKFLKNEDNVLDKNILFVSNEIESIKKTFAYLPNAYFIEEHKSDLMNHFLALYFADEALISNSTFSWWACYLSPVQEKKVYCPKYWLGHQVKIEYPHSVIPNNWIQLEV